MAIFAGHSIALFGAVWTLMCLLASAVVTDTMLRANGPASEHDDPQGPETPRRR